jgi:DNA-binding MarR family transcriptional regulator
LEAADRYRFIVATSRDARRNAARYSEAGAAVFQLLQELDRSGEIWEGEEVSRGRLAILRILATLGPMTISDVARARRTSRQGVQRLSTVLVEEGWITAHENPDDRRATRLELTEAGLAAYQSLTAAEAERLNGLARGIPVAEVRTAVKVLKTLRLGAGAISSSD